ncbi:MAG: hypothetical protein WA002_04175 [Candidatus Acidiferrales bacterium]
MSITRCFTQKRAWIVLAVLLTALCGWPLAALAQQTSFAGMIVENSCAAQAAGKSSKSWEPLPAGNSIRWPLVAEGRVRCSNTSGQLALLLAGGSKLLKKQDDAFTVPPGAILNQNIPPDPAAPARVASSDDAIFFSPPPDGTVDPQHLVLRWIPPEDLGDVVISVSPENFEQPLCCKGMAPGPLGVWDSRDLRDALTKYRDRGAAQPLELTMRDSVGREYTVSFSVLTAPEQKQLQSELASWQRKDLLVRHLGRAATFSSFSLFTEAADEYENALKVSPKSPLLLQLAAEAEQKTGNTIRALDLRETFRQVTPKP